MVGRVEDDLAPVVGQARPPVRERPDVVGLRRLEAADAERARRRRQVRPRPGAAALTTTTAPVSASTRRSCTVQQRREALEGLDVPGRPQGDVDLVGARSTYSPMRSTTSWSDPLEHAGPHELGDARRTARAGCRRPTRARRSPRSGSRSGRARRRRSAARAPPACGRTWSGRTNGTFQPSASSAAMRSVRFSPPPPIQIGSAGCTGLGSQRASVRLKCLPSWSVLSTRSSERTTRGVLVEQVEALAGATGTGCRRRRTRPATTRRRCRRRPGRRRGGRWWRWRWPAPPGAGSRRSTRASRRAPARSCRRGRRGRRRPRGSGGPTGRRRRSGPRSRSSRSRAPRCGPRGASARRSSCSAAPCAPRTTSRGGHYVALAWLSLRPRPTAPASSPERRPASASRSPGSWRPRARRHARRPPRGPPADAGRGARDATGVRAEVVAADLADADSREHLVGDVAERGLTVDVLVNNAGFSTTGPVHRSDPDREVAMLRTDVEAVAHLCSAVPARHGRARPRRGAQRGVDGRVPAAARAGRLLGVEGVRARLQPRRAGRAEGHAASRSPCCAPARSRPSSPRPPASPTRRPTSLPKFMWVSAEEVAAVGVEGMAAGRDVVIPGAANRVGAVAAHLMPKRLLVPLLAPPAPVASSISRRARCRRPGRGGQPASTRPSPCRRRRCPRAAVTRRSDRRRATRNLSWKIGPAIGASAGLARRRPGSASSVTSVPVSPR